MVSGTISDTDPTKVVLPTPDPPATTRFAGIVAAVSLVREPPPRRGAPGAGVRARERGDEKNAGVFEFFGAPGAASLNGTWWAYDKKLETKFYTLARRTFRYDPNVGAYPQSSTKVLTKADVEDFSQKELRVMRSEIYARHGYSFKKRDIREHFDDKDWYMPMAMNIAAQLTPVEKKNEALIKRYETYAAEYYDSFGR